MNAEESPKEKMPVQVSDTAKQTRLSLPLPTLNEKGQLIDYSGQLVNEKGQSVDENGKRIHIRGTRGRGDKRNAGMKLANRQRAIKLQVEELIYQERYLQEKGDGTPLRKKAETRKRQRESSEEFDATHHKRTWSATEYSQTRSATEYSTAKDDIWGPQESTVQAPQGKEERKELKIKGTANNRNTNMPGTMNNPQFHNVSKLTRENDERSADWGSDRQQERISSDRGLSSSRHRPSNPGEYSGLPRDRYLPARRYRFSAGLSPSPREARDQTQSVSKTFKPPAGLQAPSFNRRQLQKTQQLEFGSSDTARTAGFPVPTTNFEARSRGEGHQRTQNTHPRSGYYSASSRVNIYRGDGREGERLAYSWRKSGSDNPQEQRSSSGREIDSARRSVGREQFGGPIQQQSISMQYDKEVEVGGSFDNDIYADMEPTKEQTKKAELQPEAEKQS